VRALAIVALLSGIAHAEVEHNVAGSAQLDYFAIPTESTGRRVALDGYTIETSLKLAADLGHDVSANVKVCFGCHGFELGMAYFDVRVADELNIRAGRFLPAFGEFPLRHDVANHRTSDKPLPYDMGRMIHNVDFNLGVLPAPYVDTGVEVDGTHWFGDAAQLDYAVYAVTGLRGNNDAVDVDLIQSRALEYVDNNSEPAIGGRVALTAPFGDDGLVTAGVSGMLGRYDPARRLPYTIAGADLLARVGRYELHAEYLVRRWKMAPGADPAGRFRFGAVDDAFDTHVVKDGFYIEADIPLTERLTALARFDGLRRRGNVAVTSPLRADSSVLRETLGAELAIHRNLRLKLSAERYDFSDFAAELALHTAVVGSF